MGEQAAVESLAKFISDFNSSQGQSARTGSLAQIWMPEVSEDGNLVLNTQGLPYSINGVGDLLALFRCISCKYKFSTDLSKPQQMGAVGRVFTSGEPEMSHNVQRYDKHVYLRAAEAQRCRVHSTLFMPLYTSPKRDSCLGVFEVVLTDSDVNFAGMVGWIQSCLQSENLYTAEIDTATLQQNQGLRSLNDYDGVSAFESGIAAKAGATARGGAAHGEIEQQADEAAKGSGSGAASAMPPPAQRPQAQHAATSEGSGGGGGGGNTTKPKNEPAASDGAAGARQDVLSGQEGGSAKPTALQRLASGATALEGLPSPSPQQQQIAGKEGSGSGNASGQMPLPPMNGSGRMAALSGPDVQQQLGGSGGSHRLSGSLEGRQGVLGSGSLPGALPGSAHLSGSVSLPTGSTAQMGQMPPEAASLPPTVAAAMQQLLQQQNGTLAPQQLAALLSTQGLQPAGQFGAAAAGGLQLPPLLGGGGGGGGGGMNGHHGSAAGLEQQQDGGAQQLDGGQDGDDMDDDTDDEKLFLRPQPGAAQKYGQGNRVLTYDDLAAQFGYGLKEAAARLNICPTTLKRACRRLGIPRWPRRELAKHKKQKNAARDTGGTQQQANGTQTANGGGVAGRSSGSGPSSGGSGQAQMMLAAGQQHHMPRPSSSSLLSGLQGLSGIDSLLPIPGQGANQAGGLSPELAAALAASLQQPGNRSAGQPSPAMPPAANQIVGQVMQMLQQQQQQQQSLQQGGSGAFGGWHPAQQQQQHANGGMANGHLPQGAGLPPMMPMQQHGERGPGGHPLSLPPPAPLLSNLGLPRRADSKLQSVGPGMGSLDILAAVDFEASVGNMSVGNSPRIALSNLGGLSQLGLSAFDFTGAVAGGNGPAATATATGGAGGATGPQNGPAFSTGAMPSRADKH